MNIKLTVKSLKLDIAPSVWANTTDSSTLSISEIQKKKMQIRLKELCQGISSRGYYKYSAPF